MTEPTVFQPELAASPPLPIDISFDIDVSRLRDAWRAASGVNNDGGFTFVISAAEVRLFVNNLITVEARVPIDNSRGLEPPTELHLNLANESFSALGSGDLKEEGHISLQAVEMEAGFTGILELRTSFDVMWPYTVLAVQESSIEANIDEGMPVDPRTIRSALADIRDFAGEDDRSAHHFSTLEIVNADARGLSQVACQSIRSDRLERIELRMPAPCAKLLSPLLGQLRSAETKLANAAAAQVFSDHFLKVTIPLAPPAPDWPTKEVIAQIQTDVSDLLDAIDAISAQAQAQNPLIMLRVDESADSITLSTAVPGGAAIASCPISPANRIQSAPIELLFNAGALSKFRSRMQEAAQIRIFDHYIEIHQSSPTEQRKTLLSSERRFSQ